MNMSDEELDDIVLLVKKWRGFRNNRQFQKKEDKSKRKIKRSHAMIVTNLVTRGPNAQTRRSSQKKVFQVTWDDSDEDDLEEDEVQEEIVIMCFMAIEDEVTTNNNDSYNDLSTSYDEILEEFEKLLSKYSILNNKHSLLKKVVKKLFIEL
ncbi:Uncharacterized protein Adt_03917 [Abeliophyllum distichum]|uniref:Uncharacterized protein n=1 Tax=Abeliophyllum distichum TaxID=126358 RepID=A0ABD1VZV2_9LAMI